ncbi:UNVERIFIED_CONTAM: hypothetical protein HHA_461940 [Hammondia hammondi]|eukprot:XP_008883903.1 hypothetical protein HHA_461940 [Hammondia hammondi]
MVKARSVVSPPEEILSLELHARSGERWDDGDIPGGGSSLRKEHPREREEEGERDEEEEERKDKEEQDAEEEQRDEDDA